MANPTTAIKIEGVDEIIFKLKVYGQKARGNIKGAILKSGMEIVREAKKRCPVDTGRLRASIGVWDERLLKDNPEASPSDVVWQFFEREGEMGLDVGTNVDYAFDVETKPARHITGEAYFMQHGAEAATPNIKKHFEFALIKSGGGV